MMVLVHLTLQSFPRDIPELVVHCRVILVFASFISLVDDRPFWTSERFKARTSASDGAQMLTAIGAQRSMAR